MQRSETNEFKLKKIYYGHEESVESWGIMGNHSPNKAKREMVSPSEAVANLIFGFTYECGQAFYDFFNG